MPFTRRTGMGQQSLSIIAACLLLTACGAASEEAASEPDAAPEPIGSYSVDPETGEVSATLTDAAGATTTMRAGSSVDPVLPPPFVLPPDSKVTSVTRVEREGAQLVVLQFESSLAPEAVAEFFRDLASAQDFRLTADIPGKQGIVIAGEHTGGENTFSLRVEPAEVGSGGELTVTAGLG